MPSRKTYVAVAQAIKSARTAPATVDPVPEVQVACDAVAYECARHFASDNTAFDRGRFLSAAGVSRNTTKEN